MTVLVTGGAGYIGKSHGSRAGWRSRAKSLLSWSTTSPLVFFFSAFLPEGVPLFIGDADR